MSIFFSKTQSSSESLATQPVLRCLPLMGQQRKIMGHETNLVVVSDQTVSPFKPILLPWWTESVWVKYHWKTVGGADWLMVDSEDKSSRKTFDLRTNKQTNKSYEPEIIQIHAGHLARTKGLIGHPSQKSFDGWHIIHSATASWGQIFTPGERVRRVTSQRI